MSLLCRGIPVSQFSYLKLHVKVILSVEILILILICKKHDASKVQWEIFKFLAKVRGWYGEILEAKGNHSNCLNVHWLFNLMSCGCSPFSFFDSTFFFCCLGFFCVFFFLSGNPSLCKSAVSWRDWQKKYLKYALLSILGFHYSVQVEGVIPIFNILSDRCSGWSRWKPYVSASP